jgi:transcriptional regulator with XRE-family HTH domain
MSSTNTDFGPIGNRLGNLLRQWRTVRGRNQLDLSSETGISQRHISFIESGRSTPSRHTLLEIARVLDVPLRERNALLLSAGFAPVYSEAAWNSAQMQSVTKALERILHQHDPFPALVLDRYWNVLMTNDSAPRFFNCFIDMSRHKGPRNMLHLMFDPDGLRPFVEHWDEVATSLLQRVRTEATGRVIDEAIRELLEAVLTYSERSGPSPGDLRARQDRREPRCQDQKATGTESILPIIPISFRKSRRLLNYFSLVTTVGAPRTVAAQELRIESIFPADEETEKEHFRLLGSHQHKESRRQTD